MRQPVFIGLVIGPVCALERAGWRYSKTLEYPDYLFEHRVVIS